MQIKTYIVHTCIACVWMCVCVVFVWVDGCVCVGGWVCVCFSITQQTCSVVDVTPTECEA